MHFQRIVQNRNSVGVPQSSIYFFWHAAPISPSLTPIHFPLFGPETKKINVMTRIFFAFVLFLFVACDNSTPKVIVKEMNLKRGELISCGPTDKQFGSLSFDITASDKVKEDFNLGVKLLHSFVYDEAEKVFARVIDADPDVAMAYWGVAMSNFHPLWTPPLPDELKKGAQAVEIAKQLKNKSKRESEYIDAIAAYYTDHETVDHRTRSLRFEQAMEKVYKNNPGDKEAAILYSLSLTAAADPADKEFVKQKKAGEILKALQPNDPNHPGIVHYLIHTYDSPELAHLGLEAAKKYASVAPSAAHALHMPSHIFTRLGLWQDAVESNLASVASAQCYAQQAGIKGHWDEEIHGLDYLVYAYLQKGDNLNAKKWADHLAGIKEVHPDNFKVAYAFASIPSRYAFENKDWKTAASVTAHVANYPWDKFPWQGSILTFTRLLGSVHVGDVAAARTELEKLKKAQQTLLDQKDAYKAGQVNIQAKAGEAWILWKEGKNAEALKLMNEAAELEDKTEKHPVTPGEIVPARQLLADLYMEMNEPAKALVEYEKDLKKHPNRFNGMYGAGLAAEKSGDKVKAKEYYTKLLAIASASNSSRTEVQNMNSFLSKN